MITYDQIEELPRKYAIGKRPLSRVLGWGELTYTRLLEGSIPTPQHEQELLTALNEPLTYIMLLDQAHDAGAVSDTSYAKSRRAAEEYLYDDPEAEDVMKLHAVARRFCVLANGDVTPKALQLLVYFAQQGSARPLFSQSPSFEDGAPEYTTLVTWYTFNRIQEAGKSSKDYAAGLEAEEIDLIDAVFEKYGIYSSIKLEKMAESAPAVIRVPEEEEITEELAAEEPQIIEEEKPEKKDKQKKRQKEAKKSKKSSKKSGKKKSK